MSQRNSYHLFILLAVFQSSFPQRRIKDGKEVISDKKYVLQQGMLSTYENSRDVVERIIRDLRNDDTWSKEDDGQNAEVAFTEWKTVNGSVERKATTGQTTTSLVYLLRAASAPNQYHGWLCGGAIINKDYVMTSAACVQDVRHIYVVAGYKKYVSADRIEEDPCVKEKKKKVVLTCVPRSYQFDYNRTEVWAKIDIAVIKVESSFDFNDKSYETSCSYTPQPIDFNTEKEFPKPGDDVIVLGWGHTKEFRKDKDLVDLNQATLHYAPTRVLEEQYCVKYFNGNKALASIIASSMLCTLEPGNLNDKGELILRSPPIAQGCITEAARLRGAVGRMCEDDAIAEAMIYEGGIDGPEMYDDSPGGEFSVVNKTRRRGNATRKRVDDGNKVLRRVEEVKDYETEIFVQDGAEGDVDDEAIEGGEDTPGICQNDHGGPLVAWRGGQEVLVAVATLYKLDNKHRCMGPYLFTKTWCNGAFLKCIVDQDKDDQTRRRCDDPEEVGFEIVRRHISWVGHRDGPAENEQIQLRNQVPMSAFQPTFPRPRPKA